MRLLSKLKDIVQSYAASLPSLRSSEVARQAESLEVNQDSEPALAEEGEGLEGRQGLNPFEERFIDDGSTLKGVSIENQNFRTVCEVHPQPFHSSFNHLEGSISPSTRSGTPVGGAACLAISAEIRDAELRAVLAACSEESLDEVIKMVHVRYYQKDHKHPRKDE